MIRFDYLQQLGFSTEYISTLVDNHLISLKKDGYEINDFNFLLSLINNYPNVNLYDLEDKRINKMLDELFRLVRLGQNKLAYELALRIDTITNINEVKLIINNIDHKYDPLKYILEEGVYPSDVTNEGLKKIERNMLINYLIGDDREGNEDMMKLSKIYVYQNPSEFVTYKAYLAAILELEKNHTSINVRKDANAAGDPIGVLCALIKCKDYYRAHSILKEYYLDNIKDEFSVAWEIYRIYDEHLMTLLKRNTENVYKQMELNANGLNTIKEIVGKYDLSHISSELIDAMSKKNDYSIDEDKNYYEEYLKHKDKGSYEEARLDIIKHQRKLGEMGIFVDYDYLIKETDILLYISIYDSDEQKEEHNNYLKLANDYKLRKDYINAIKYYKESLKYESKETPLTLSKIAECYMELKDYTNAVFYYKRESNDFLYPIDYLHYIESLYYLGRYDEIFPLADGYEYYYPTESAFIHYILSICYLERNNYKLALDHIDTCEIISMEYYDLALNFNYERDIIKDLERGKDVPSYTLDDFYSHCFNETTLNKINQLEIDKYPEDGSLLINIIHKISDDRVEEQINFMLKVSKVLKEMNRRKDAKDLLKYIEDVIKTTELSATDNEHFTVVLKNYRNL